MEKIFLINSKMIDNNCIDSLKFISASLKHVEIERCPDVTSKGVLSLARLKNLKYLRLHKLEGVTSEEWTQLKDNSKKVFPNVETVFDAAKHIEAENALPPPGT